MRPSTCYARLVTFILPCLFCIASTSYGLPFTIVPASTLPTTVSVGGTVPAFYTVTNNTAQPRSGNYVKWLPPNVTQMTSAGLCGISFNLGASGSVNASCVLGLTVSGPVNANDPNPHHHLFVCFPGGITCAGTNYPLNIAGSTTLAFAAVGESFNSLGSNELPLAYTSSDNGQDWTLSPAFILPSGQTQGQLLDFNCGGNTCTSVGSTFGINELPVAYTSSDGGINWSLSSSFLLPGGQTSGSLSGIACVNNLCATVGSSISSLNLSSPLTYTSNNGGSNWGSPSSPSLPGSQTEGILTSVACTGSICTAVGNSFQSPNINFLPLVYTSNNSGNSWTLSPALPLNLPQPQGTLNGVTCIGSMCTAVGTSFQAGGGNQLPLAYTSNDSGNSWTLSASLPLNLPQPEGQLNAVTCTGNFCIAVGTSFQAGGGNQLPLIYTSNDSGNHWTLTPALPNLPQPQGILNLVTCLGNICAAMGESFQAGRTNELPLVYTSNDSGNTWTPSSPLPLPSGQSQGALGAGGF